MRVFELLLASEHVMMKVLFMDYKTIRDPKGVLILFRFLQVRVGAEIELKCFCQSPISFCRNLPLSAKSTSYPLYGSGLFLYTAFGNIPLRRTESNHPCACYPFLFLLWLTNTSFSVRVVPEGFSASHLLFPKFSQWPMFPIASM